MLQQMGCQQGCLFWVTGGSPCKAGEKLNCLDRPSPKFCVCQRPRWPGQSPRPLHGSALTLTPPLRSCSQTHHKWKPHTKPQDFLTIHPARTPPCSVHLKFQGKVGSSPFPACHSNAATQNSSWPKHLMVLPAFLSPSKSPNCSSRFSQSSVGCTSASRSEGQGAGRL